MGNMTGCVNVKERTKIPREITKQEVNKQQIKEPFKESETTNINSNERKQLHIENNSLTNEQSKSALNEDFQDNYSVQNNDNVSYISNPMARKTSIKQSKSMLEVDDLKKHKKQLKRKLTLIEKTPPKQLDLFQIDQELTGEQSKVTEPKNPKNQKRNKAKSQVCLPPPHSSSEIAENQINQDYDVELKESSLVKKNVDNQAIPQQVLEQAVQQLQHQPIQSKKVSQSQFKIVVLQHVEESQLISDQNFLASIKIKNFVPPIRVNI